MKKIVLVFVILLMASVVEAQPVFYIEKDCKMFSSAGTAKDWMLLEHERGKEAAYHNFIYLILQGSAWLRKTKTIVKVVESSTEINMEVNVYKVVEASTLQELGWVLPTSLKFKKEKKGGK